MTSRRLGVIALGLQIAAFVFARPARAEVRTTTTVLPVTAESTPARSDNMLKISANGSEPIESTSTALLKFDLRSIPQNANITAATLRVVGRSNGSNPQPQVVKITADPQTESLGQWTAVKDETVFLASTDRLKQRIAAAVHAQQQVSLRLASKGRQSDWDYYSLSETYLSSYKPRLIVEYTLPVASENTPEFNTTTRTFWSYPANVKDVILRSFFGSVTPISNPAFYRGDVYLFGKASSQDTALYDIAPGGHLQWSTVIRETPGSNAIASSTGLLYSLGANHIRLFDLHKQGAMLRAGSVPNLTLDVPATLGADDSVYFVPSGNGNVYGLSPEQKELWRYPAENNAGSATVSRITLSPVAQRYAYILMRRGTKNALATINAADGSGSLVTLNDKYTGFYRPVVVAGPEHDYVVVAAFSEGAGTLSAYSGGELRWETSGSISQPVTDRAHKKVFAVREGLFRAFDILNGNEVCASKAGGPALSASSNLVADGDDNVYFWNNGRFYGFHHDCQLIFDSKLSDLPKELELMFGQDGTLYARTQTQQLYTLTPVEPSGQPLQQNDIRTNTVYAGRTLRTADNLNLRRDVRVTFKAESGITLTHGFSVELGSRLRCQIGL